MEIKNDEIAAALFAACNLQHTHPNSELMMTNSEGINLVSGRALGSR